MLPHVVVVGLGAMGAAVAWRLALAGARVTGLDARRPPHGFGSTHGRSRIIREAYFEHPQYVPLVRRAFDLWAELERRTRTLLFQACGGLTIGRPDSALFHGAARSAELHGVPVHRWTTAELRARAPVLLPPEGAEVLFEPRAGVLTPEGGLEAMLRAAREAGALLRFDTALKSWQARAPGVSLETTEAPLRADLAVLAAGPWLSDLAAGVELPLTVERAVQYWYPTANDQRYHPRRLPVFMIEREGDRLLYGLPDQGDGLKLAEHHGGRTGTPETIDRDVSGSERRAFHAFASESVELPSGPTAASVCLYTNTPDGHFILDRHPRAGDVYLVSACSGHGFKFAPAIGEAVAAELTGRPAPVNLDPFRLARFERRD